MDREFEGKTEQEAIARAIDELGLERDDFDVEIIDSQKKGFFKKGSVKICVHVADDSNKEAHNIDSPVKEEVAEEGESLAPENDNEQKVIDYLTELLSKMGYPATVKINFRRDNKVGFDISSEASSIIIGRKGKNLDAIQLIVNVYAGNLDPEMKVVIDSENYRMRHEEQIIRLAYKTAEIVKRTGRSKILEPMNPFERRLVHTALNNMDGVDTKSEGEGLYKQVRILPIDNRK